MNKKVLLAILTAAVLLLSGCTLNSIDTVADAAQVILSITNKVTGKTETVTKGTLSNLVSYNQTQNQQMNDLYSQVYGYAYNAYPTDAKTILSQLISSFTQQNVLKLKGNELGMDKLTDEELAEVTASAKEDYENMLLTVEENYITSGATGDALRDEAEQYAASHGLTTMDEFIAQYTDEKTAAKLEASVKDAVQVTDEDITARLAELVETAKTNYADNLVSFCDAANKGDTMYYTPAGFRYIKHILISFSDEQQAAINTAKTAVDEANTALTDAQKAVTDAEAALESAAEGDAKTKAQEALDTAKAALTEAEQAVTDAETTYNNTVAAAEETVKTKVDEVYAKATAANADFDALIAEYGEDPGMTQEPAKTKGYAVCEGYNFVEPFMTEALKLEKVGDVSAPVATNYGVHIIKYVGEGTESEMTFDDAKLELHDTMLNEMQTAAYDSALETWTGEMDIKTYTDRMGY